MKVYLIGVGMGNPATLTGQAPVSYTHLRAHET